MQNIAKQDVLKPYGLDIQTDIGMQTNIAKLRKMTNEEI